MKFLFDDEAFSFETRRSTGFAVYGGADLGEVLRTTAAIAEGDEPSRHDSWTATALNNGIWAMGVDSYAELIRHTKLFSLDGIAEQIAAPALIMDAENDQFLKGQPQEVELALPNSATTLVTLTEAEGAGEHCHMGAMFRAHQTMFDWLETTLAIA